METCVLVPHELSVVLRVGGDDREEEREMRGETPGVQTARSPGISDRLHPKPHPLASLEMSATVWANCRLAPGTTFCPDQGTVRLEKLEIYSKLRHDDVRYQFGMFDDIHLIDDNEVRHCNWVRFLRSRDHIKEVNLVASKVAGNIVFQVVNEIPPNGELTVYFDPSTESVLPPSITDTMLQKERLNSSLNTSRDSRTSCDSSSDNVTPPRASKSSSRSSPESLGVHSLATTPSDKEDDGRSTLSDVTNISEDSHHSHSIKSCLSMNSSYSSDARTPGGITPSPSPRRPLPTNDSSNITPPTTRPSPSSRPFSTPIISSTFTSPNFSSPPFTSPSMTSPSMMSPSMTSPSMTSPSMTSPSMTSPSMSSPLTSPLCGKSPDELLRLPVKRNRERTWLPCDVCGKKFDRPSLLRRHMRTHTGEKPHACDVCGKAFSTSSSLNTHRRIHSGEKPHQCPTCGKRFTASSNLYYHRMTHNKDKPHKCTLCSKSFPTPGDLKSHMYVHNGSWPFKCDICNRGFSKHTNLKNHLLLHTGDKPHECDLCGKKFALQCNLKTHMKTHEGEAQEECYKCGRVSLVAARQIYNGYCRTCIQAGPGSTHPGPALPGPPPPHPATTPGGPSPSTPRHQSFSVESLATSSIHRPTPLTPGGASGAASGALSMSGGYAMFETKPEIGSLPTQGGHGNAAMFSYAAGLQWPKLVPQQY